MCLAVPGLVTRVGDDALLLAQRGENLLAVGHAFYPSASLVMQGVARRSIRQVGGPVKQRLLKPDPSGFSSLTRPSVRANVVS